MRTGTLENGDESIAQLAKTGASDAVQAALLGYVLNGTPVGHFLTALLSNDLSGTVAYADDQSILAIPALVRWLYNEVPAPCWGSPAAVKAWQAEAQP